MTTLLTIINNVQDKLTLPRSSSVIGSSDQSARTLLAHAQDEGDALVKECPPWTELQVLHTFTTTNGTAEYVLPDDYDRLITDTEWDRTTTWPLIGPVSPQEWQAIKSGTVGSGLVGRRLRIYQASAGPTTRTIYIDPTPTVTGDTLAFEYVSKNWCASSGGTGQAAWAADDDVAILNDKLMEKGIHARYLRGRGFDFSSIADEYNLYKDTLKAQNRPSRTLSMSPRKIGRLLNNNNLPDTGFGA